METFLVAHENYHKNLQNPENIEESDEYYNTERTRVNYLKERITNFLENPINPHDVRPEDSVSNAGEGKLSCKLKSSKLSRISLTSIAKANAIVRKATLEAEAKNLEKNIALQQELPLQQQREALELEIELAKARPKSGCIMKLRLFRKIYNSRLHRKTKSPIQKNPQLPPPQKNEQNCADETEFKCQQES